MPLQAWTGPGGLQVVEAPRFQDNRHIKLVRLSAPRTGRFYPPGNIPGTHFCWRLSRPQDYSAAGRMTSRSVGQCLNQLCHRAPLNKISVSSQYLPTPGLVTRSVVKLGTLESVFSGTQNCEITVALVTYGVEGITDEDTQTKCKFSVGQDGWKKTGKITDNGK